MTTPAPDAETRITNALKCAEDGIYDGVHHKDWVIDQMVRALTGCPVVTRTAIDARGNEYGYEAQGESEDYLRFVAGRDWSEGIAP